jgi:hypothetical protein
MPGETSHSWISAHETLGRIAVITPTDHKVMDDLEAAAAQIPKRRVALMALPFECHPTDGRRLGGRPALLAHWWTSHQWHPDTFK